jgi:microcystin-dependent protein
MSDAFIGEIRLFASSFIPSGWINCDGRTLQIFEYQALYSVIGNTYGGSVTSRTFALPNLNGAAGALPNRAVCGIGQSAPQAKTWPLAGTDGSEQVTLSQSQLPRHTHQMIRSGGNWVATKKFSEPAPKSQLGGLYVDATTIKPVLTDSVPNTVLSPLTVTSAGGSSAHENRQPFLALYFAINNDGEYPVSS